MVSATDLILLLIEHEVPQRSLTHLLDLEAEGIAIVEIRLPEDSPVVGRTVGEAGLPEHTLVISIIRDGHGFVPGSHSVFRVGDGLLAALHPEMEEDLKRVLGA